MPSISDALDPDTVRQLQQNFGEAQVIDDDIFDPTQLTSTDLQDEIDARREVIRNINLQLMNDTPPNGKPDPNWRHRAEDARRYRQKEIDQLQAVLDSRAGNAR